MASHEPTEAPDVSRTRLWMFWRWSLPPYRGRRDRLSPEAQGQAANHNMRAGH
jgi:hypothetical protein